MGNDLDHQASQIGKWVKAWRERRGMSQEQLAAALGISGKTVSRWERGVNPPSGGLLMQVSDVLDAELSTLAAGNVSKIAPRGTKQVREPDPDSSEVGDDSWSPNPALRNKIPKRAYDVAIAYCRRLHSAGWPTDEIEQIERLMIDARYAQANKRKGTELTEDEFIMLIDATWEAVRHFAASLGRQV